MGYSLCGSLGVSFAHDDEKVVVVCGDGDVQMVIQELATIREYDLNISIFVLNNSQLGVSANGKRQSMILTGIRST